MTRATRTPIAAAVLGVLLAACGSAASDPAASDPASRRAAASGGNGPVVASDLGPRRVDPRRGGFELGFGEFAITMEAEEIRPGPVTFIVRNGGALVHGFEIEREDGDDDNSGPGHGGLKLEGPAFGPGEVVRIRADLPPGVYEIECFVAEHDDRGMRAFLVVRQGAPLVRAEDPSRSPNEVQISDFAFSPTALEVDVGTEVTWTNADPTAHTVTAEGGAFDSGAIDPRRGFSTVFEQAGEFRYVCEIHPTMRGVVRVG
jgi:plastocyanin